MMTRASAAGQGVVKKVFPVGLILVTLLRLVASKIKKTDIPKSMQRYNAGIVPPGAKQARYPVKRTILEPCRSGRACGENV